MNLNVHKFFKKSFKRLEIPGWSPEHDKQSKCITNVQNNLGIEEKGAHLRNFRKSLVSQTKGRISCT